MRKVHIVSLIIIGIVASKLHNVNCCKSRRSRRHQKNITDLNDKEKKSLVLRYEPSNANIPDCDSYEADHANILSDIVQGITFENSRKIKRNTPEFQNVPLHHDNDNLKNTAPNTLIATLADSDDNAEALSNNQKIKRNPSVKPRRVRDKKYMCLCEETQCSNKDCFRNQAQKSPSNTENEEDTSAEVFDDVNVIQKTSNEPKKFNIPFANNVNFDQRVIVDAKNAQPTPPTNTFYPVYANPQIYHYTPYTLAHPGLIYTGVTPMQQNYAPAAGYNQFPSPSPIPANLLKLWKNGAQNLLPVDNNPKQKPQYVPNYSSENTNNAPESPVGSNKVTTPRQVDNKLYPQNNPSSGNIEDFRPAYSYSTDFPYNQKQYTTEIVSADLLKFITEKPTGAKQLQFGDPTTTNYAPNYYSTQRTDGNNQYPPNYQTNPQNSYANLNPDAAYPNNNQNVPQYDYNGMPVSTSPPVGYQPQDAYYQPDSEELSIEVDKVINGDRNNAPTMSVPNDADLRDYDPPQNQAASRPYNRPPDFVIQPPASYNIENVNSPREGQSNTEMYNNVPQRVTTLEDVNTGYTNHYNPQKTATLRNTNGYKKNDNVAAPTTEPDHMENLFRGLEKILLNNVSVSDTPQTQAVDERPSTTYENSGNALVQNAVKKVLNNFVPGKSEDLLANYGTERTQELSRENAESLSPDLANTHVLRSLLNVPEVENMIVETTNNLLHQLVGSPCPDNVIRDTLRNVVNEIPRPTSPPPKRSPFNINIRLTKRLPRYDDSSNREVFEKIKSIINKSELDEEAATHPVAQNLIVKAVKHSLDKEKGAVDEGAIRRAFNQLVKSRRSNDSYNSGPVSANGRPLIVQPKGTMDNYDQKIPLDTVYTTEDTGYKLAPAVPVKERRLQGGVWIETPKNLIGPRGPGKSTTLEEKRKKEWEKQLDMLQKYSKPNIANEITEKVDSPYYTTTSQNSDVSTREAVSRFYDGMDITPNPKTVQYYPQADPKNAQYYPQVDPKNNQYSPQGNRYHGYPSTPVVTTINYNYRNPSYTTTQQPNDNQLNLLVDSTQSPTEGVVEQKVDTTEDPAYMGKLVPLNAVNRNLDNSNLVWVGDGVRLPLTVRKMQDGSYALTLSDEVCKMFMHKKCPCCLPDARQGVIVRERRNDENDFKVDGRSGKQFTNNIPGNYRVRRDSGEVTTTLKTFSNTIGKHDFNDADYDESQENNSIQRGAPYKYQRFANEDRIISGRTRALGNMLKWMKDVVTEAHKKRYRRRVSPPKHKVALLSGSIGV